MTEETSSNAPSAPESKSNKLAGRLISALVFVGAVLMALYLLQQRERYPQTSDAYVMARYITVSSEVPGRISALPASDGLSVEPGDLLVQVDPESYALGVAETKAQIGVLEAQINEAERQRAASEAMVQMSRENTERTLAQEALAKSTYERMTPLAEQGFVTQEKYDAATSAYEQARASVLMAQSNELAAELSVASLETLRAELQAARIGLQQAEVELQRTAIRAPFDGRVVNCDLAPGMMVMPGESLFTLVDTSEWFVVANYREGDLENIAVGDVAKVRVLTLPGKVFTGKVASIGLGVQTQDGYNFGPLPSVKNNLNWIRVAQRFPVRIRIDSPEPADAFRIGASSMVTIEKP
ncbi:efflux RND transporter periplasmic adaptor subunit [Cerasicoccus fimbriatus]|uniref:efflux RND transporter periplasmic adaptor subunit n=1 Tax=Cerasicoccus fimbriatus TaxID=3014554 RepID=UPI0022B47122|nr:efflux RND transporter periplasmic adaptor subunit [Cerasicoccus sp. TK19100]